MHSSRKRSKKISTIGALGENDDRHKYVPISAIFDRNEKDFMSFLCILVGPEQANIPYHATVLFRYRKLMFFTVPYYQSRFI
jgi:hypothetical protein